jgi:hypothetical protein
MTPLILRLLGKVFDLSILNINKFINGGHQGRKYQGRFWSLLIKWIINCIALFNVAGWGDIDVLQTFLVRL